MTLTIRRSATGAELRWTVAAWVASEAAGPSTRVVELAPSLVKGVPHSPQNLAPSMRSAPQLGQVSPRRAPHSRQNLRPGRFAVPQFPQITAGQSLLAWLAT
jgi:hypothetical protein